MTPGIPGCVTVTVRVTLPEVTVTKPVRVWPVVFAAALIWNEPLLGPTAIVMLEIVSQFTVLLGICHGELDLIWTTWRPPDAGAFHAAGVRVSWICA